MQEVCYDPKSPSGILVEVDGMSTVRVNSNLKALGAAEERTNIVFQETRTVSGTGEKVELAREDLSRASCQQVEEHQRKPETHQDWSSEVLGVRIDSQTELQAQSFANGKWLFVSFCVLHSIEFVVGLLEVAVMNFAISSNRGPKCE